jgi:DNA polymerase/3'-5' exonuclease PolX
MLSNAEIAGRLTEIADLLDLLGERFKPEAYRRAARSIESLPEGLERFAARGELRRIPGVGEAIAGKIDELLRTGGLAYLEKLRAEIPGGVLELMRLPGVGPKTARRFWTELGIDGPAALAGAIAAGRLEGVSGFAEKKISQLRAATARAADGGSAPTGRRRIEEVWPVARAIVRTLRAVTGVRQVEVAGSFRRAREDVGDLDVLATAEAPADVFDAFSGMPEIQEVRLRGTTKETVVLTGGLQVDLRVVEPAAFGAALQYFTGSKDHNVRLRSLARDQGLKVNEYGVYREERRIAGATEEDVYRSLGLAWIPPELREDRGEIAEAASGRLPRLVDEHDLVAELHVHLPERASAPELAGLVAEARRRSLRSVGVVVATIEDGELRSVVAAGVAEALREPHPDGPQLHPVVEVQGDPSRLPGPLLSGGAGEYLVVVPRPLAETPVAVPPLPVRLLAHFDAPPGATAPLLEIACAWGAAVEVGPGLGRLDSSTARTARLAGVALALPTGIGRPPDDPTAGVALGFARRAGASRDDVANAGGPPTPSRTGATGRKAPSGRRRR